MVLISEGNTFEVLTYRGSDEQIIQKGKPTDLSFLSRERLKNREVTAASYKWNDGVSNDTLNRADGTLIVNYPGAEANLPGCKGGDCLEFMPNMAFYNCKFGEKGKKLFWEATVRDYERKVPKF